MFNNVWNVWINVWLALAIFGLFGLTGDARKVYVRAYSTAIRRTRQLHPGHSQSEILALPPPSTDQSGQIRSAYLKYVDLISSASPA